METSLVTMQRIEELENEIKQTNSKFRKRDLEKYLRRLKKEVYTNGTKKENNI